LSGRTLKGSIFGGLKVKSDLPILMEKCKNKVCPYQISMWNEKMKGAPYFFKKKIKSFTLLDNSIPLE
jgi:hypothetical protein